MIVDTHVHILTDDRVAYPQIADTARAGTIPTVTDLGQSEWPTTTAESLIAMMDEAGIGCATAVQSYFKYAFDNSYTAGSARQFPGRFLGICVLDYLDPAAPDQLTRLVEEGGIAGLRLMRSSNPDYRISDRTSFPLWERAAALGINVCVSERRPDLGEMAELLRRFPTVLVAFEHMWGVDIGDPPYDRLKSFFELAELPNAYVKIAVNNSHAAREGESTPTQLFTKLVDTFGADRVMWGSNYPAHPKYGPLRDRLELAKADFGFLDETDREWIFGATARKFWPALQGMCERQEAAV